MRDFLKQNLLAIIVCLFAMGVFASASTLTRPYTSADYAGGAKAVGSKVNSEFDTIVNWLNGANISSDNIASGGVATANIAAAAVTNAKLAASGIKITSTSSIFTTTSFSATTITNLSTTITTSGRPIWIGLIPDHAGSLSGGVLNYLTGVGNAGAGITDYGEVFFLRSNTTVADFFISSSSTTNPINHPCSSFSAIDVQSAGTYTYTVKAATKNTSYPTQISGCKLAVREIL